MTHPPVELPRLEFQRLSAKVLGIPLETIQSLAEVIYIEGGFQNGRSVENWVEAERRLISHYLPRPAQRRPAANDGPDEMKPATSSRKAAPPANKAAAASTTQVQETGSNHSDKSATPRKKLKAVPKPEEVREKTPAKKKGRRNPSAD